jgi:hypothetical protein
MTEEIPECLGRESAKEEMMVRFRCGNEERENRNWKLQNVLWGEREIIEHMWKKGTGRNTEWRWKGDKMDERDMEEEGKNRKKRGEREIFMFALLPIFEQELLRI